MKPKLTFSFVLLKSIMVCGLVHQIVAQETDVVQITGKTLAVINNGDFVHPKISPDGNHIAYSRVVVEGDLELTEVAVKNIKTNRTRVLLTPKASEKYATYRAFISKMEWLDNTKLIAFVSDGDVDYSKLTFNSRTGQLVKTEYSGDEDDFEIVPSQLKFAINSIQIISPKLSKEVISTGLQVGSGAFNVGDRGVVLQYRYGGSDDHIRFFDFQKKSERILLEVSKTVGRLPRLLGGFVLGEKFVFVVAYQETISVYEHNDGKTMLLREEILNESDKDMPELAIKFQTSDEILFLVKPYSTISGMRASLWLYDRNGLRKATDVDNLLDVDVNVKAGRIAFCYWVDKNRRHIIVKGLRAF